MRSLRTWWMKRPPLILRRFLDGVSRWCEFDLEARMPVRDFRRRTPPGALCRAHRRNRAQPDQSGRCAARTGIHQLAEADLDLLRTLRGVHLRRNLISIEESGCNARTKRMTKETLMSPEFDKRIPAALLILRFFLGTFLLQWSIEKLILPDAAARIANNFYGVTLPAAGSYALYRVLKSMTLGRFPNGGESDSTRRTEEVRHVG